jgi:DNA-binding FadR family transcriptional regulator
MTAGTVRGGRVYEELIPALATATRIACLRLTDAEPEVTADAEIFALLAESVRDPGMAGVLRLGPAIVRDLALTVGPNADGIISNSNRRLLAHLRAADADAAGYEMERFLRCLHLMWRLARGSREPPD